MNETLQSLMHEATRLTQAGRLGEATEAIQRALSGAFKSVPVASPSSERQIANAPQLAVDASPSILDGVVLKRAVEDDVRTAADEFISGTYTHAGHAHPYKLYVPPASAIRSLPLVVMLHGCTQDPDDFAAGTGMNTLAKEQGFFVLYPAQSKNANPQRCWNWFQHNHQQRGSGEPRLLAEMVQSVMQTYGIDPKRVYIAGLSAGGAMADIVAAAYPEIFAASGVHSGLPSGAASNVAEAFAVMKNGAPAARPNEKSQRFGKPLGAVAKSRTSVPTIVFHGEQDQTVSSRNGDQVVAAVLRSAATNNTDPHASSADPSVEQGVSTGGQRFTRSIHRSESGAVLAEHWLVHGASHAWSGGSATGSYTDATGPDASREMLRFFFEHPHADAG